MENVNEMRQIIEKILTEKAEFYRRINNQKADENMVELVFDRERDSYVLFNIAWEKYERTYYPVAHLDIVNGKIWIQKDATEEGIATDLENLGVPKDKIVLAFHSPTLRKYGEYAFA